LRVVPQRDSEELSEEETMNTQKRNFSHEENVLLCLCDIKDNLERIAVALEKLNVRK